MHKAFKTTDSIVYISFNLWHLIHDPIINSIQIFKLKSYLRKLINKNSHPSGVSVPYSVLILKICKLWNLLDSLILAESVAELKVIGVNENEHIHMLN